MPVRLLDFAQAIASSRVRCGRLAARAALAACAGAAGLLAAACSPALNWREVQASPARAMALLPCKPEHATRSVPLGGAPTELSVAGCEAGGATFALMSARVPAGRLPDELLAGWQRATLANMAADANAATRRPFRPAGGLPLAHAERIAAQGRDGAGQAIAADAVWSAHAAPDGGTELLHAVVYAPRRDARAADAFFEGIRWP